MKKNHLFDSLNTGPLSMLDEYYQNIYYQVLEESTRDYLHALGLSYRIDEVIIEPDTWVVLFKLAYNAVTCTTCVNPKQLQENVLLGTDSRELGGSDWIQLTSDEGKPYWVEQSDLPKLVALELMLNNLSRPTSH